LCSEFRETLLKAIVYNLRGGSDLREVTE